MIKDTVSRPAVPRQKKELPMERKTRILLVEDHPIFREGLHLALSFAEADFDVVAQVRDVRQAVDYIQSHPDGIDVAILDYFLPDGNASNVMDSLKSFSPRAKALIVTGDVDHPNVRKLAGTQGVAGVISKNVQSAELVQLITAIMKGERVSASGTPSPTDWVAETGLTQREVEIIHLFAQGKDAKEIADALFISPKTVYRHRENIFLKTGTTSTVELLRFAIKNGLL